jgi:hypothetical protein
MLDWPENSKAKAEEQELAVLMIDTQQKGAGNA